MTYNFTNCEPAVCQFNKVPDYLENTHDIAIQQHIYNFSHGFNVYFVFDVAGFLQHFTLAETMYRTRPVRFGLRRQPLARMNRLVITGNTYHDYSDMLAVGAW